MLAKNQLLSFSLHQHYSNQRFFASSKYKIIKKMNSGSGLGDYNLDLSGPITSVKKEAIKQQIKQELAMANAQELINNINKNCFKMCVPSPGTSLSSSEEVSLNRCIDKYLASWDIVSQAYVSRIQREKH